MEEPKITPLARRLAEENGIDWRRLKGSGPEGTIVERDILAYLARVMAGEVELPPASSSPPPPPREEDLKRAEAVLSREGVELSELIPERIREEPKAGESSLEPWELEPDLEMDLEALLREESQEFREREPLWEGTRGASVQGAPPPPSLGEAPKGVAQAPLGLAPPAGRFPSSPGLRVFRRVVRLSAVEEGLAALAEAFSVPPTPLPFLLKAAEKALRDVGLSLKPLLGRTQGESVSGWEPSGNFLDWFREVGIPTDEAGLLCFFGPEEVHTGQPSLFLAPDGILAVSGLEAEKARALLERVALYLEKPLLLLA